MPSSSARPPALLQRGLVCTGLLGVTALTVIGRGATRMYATPWNLLLALVLLVPLLLLVVRALPSPRPFSLPPKSWLWLAGASALVALISASASPFHGPSLLAAMTPLAGIAVFLLLCDWLAEEPDRHAQQLERAIGWIALAVVLSSLGPWLANVVQDRLWTNTAALVERRNGNPLGHSNYTAGLALLAMPWLAALAWRTAGIRRFGWAVAVLLALAMLISSGSRSGMAGFGVMLAVALFHARPSGRVLVIALMGAVALAATVIVVNPRTRTLLVRRASTLVDLRASTVQRSAMLTAGIRMGRDRPVPGWGPGTTALVYPNYRAQLDGGVESALQLHSSPVQLWADYGALGIVAALAFLGLAARSSVAQRGSWRIVPGSSAVAGYAAFSLFDFQLDVPIFPLALASGAAVLAASGRPVISPRAQRIVVVGVIVALGAFALGGRVDPTPALNVRARARARARADATQALAHQQDSLRLNPAQEIAHFNLGWLLVVREPAEAERHFLAAARLVPDKGGVYFGLGLALLNQPGARTAEAAHAFAIECVNDPLFLTSPWWKTAALAPLRPLTLEFVRQICAQLGDALQARHDPRAREARWVAALTSWLEGTDAPGEMLALAHTSERVRYFVGRPARPDFEGAAIVAYRRERKAYPVLMRNLDLPPPVDLFDVQENALAAGELRFLFPAKGWLPGPRLQRLLERAVSSKP